MMAMTRTMEMSSNTREWVVRSDKPTALMSNVPCRGKTCHWVFKAEHRQGGKDQNSRR
jgi:hypothetical protein